MNAVISKPAHTAKPKAPAAQGAHAPAKTRAQGAHAPAKKGSAVVLALAAGHSFADSAMLGLQLGAVAAALIALDMAARFFGCTHRGLPLARSICPWRMPGSALSVEILDGSRGGIKLGDVGANFHDPSGKEGAD